MRPFYIIGHNPNYLDEALSALRQGANALEPDIHYWDDEDSFRVYHTNPNGGDVPTIEEYLQGLTRVLKDDESLRSRLALIAFDLKPPYNYDINRLYAIIHREFSVLWPNVAILTTVSDPDAASFISQVLGKQMVREGIGVDQNASPAQVVGLLSNKNLNFSYATGNSILSSANYVHLIVDALNLRDAAGDNGLEMVYVWTVNGDDEIRLYLDLPQGIDGVITDDPARVAAVLAEPAYNTRFRLAVPGDNPFFAPAAFKPALPNLDTLTAATTAPLVTP